MPKPSEADLHIADRLTELADLIRKGVVSLDDATLNWRQDVVETGGEFGIPQIKSGPFQRIDLIISAKHYQYGVYDDELEPSRKEKQGKRSEVRAGLPDGSCPHHWLL